jgi:GDPmannose 4,6-dehydratase
MTGRALITGITGQDGSYLSEFLLGKGYEVFGMVRAVTDRDSWRLCGVRDQVVLLEGDITDPRRVREVVIQAAPSEIYNLAAQSFVGQSWGAPNVYIETNGIGFLNILEAARTEIPYVRIYQASSSEQFGEQPDPQNELTPMLPRSPYGASKLLAHSLANIYRESYTMFVACGICFNHESPRRGAQFVSRKICQAAARIKIDRGHAAPLEIGSVAAGRDWGYAPDYVEAMWLMLQAGEAKDYVIATGKTHSVRDWIDRAYDYVGLTSTRERTSFIHVDEELFRPAEIFSLRGDAVRANKELGWYPRTDFDAMVRLMVDAEVENAVQQRKAAA